MQYQGKDAEVRLFHGKDQDEAVERMEAEGRNVLEFSVRTTTEGCVLTAVFEKQPARQMLVEG